MLYVFPSRLVAAAFCLAFASSLTLAADASWKSTVLRGIAASEYEFSASAAGGYVAPNRANGFRMRVDPVRLALEPRDGSRAWRVDLSLEAWGRPSASEPAGPGELRLDPERPVRLELARQGLVEWYVNEPRGLEHGFTLRTRPEGEGELVFDLAVGGTVSVTPATARGLDLTTEDGTVVLQYDKLLAFDSTGRMLPARMERLDGHGLRISVNDDGAIYPILIDPLVTSPDWSTESGNAFSSFGSAVASAGDVNGDGYDDVLVGAHFFDTGEVGEEQEGRVFLYLGSATGPSTGFSWKAESNHPGADFGVSVAGGDVNGDGYSDVIVGCPDYDLGNAPEINEGWVFVWYGSGTGNGLGADGTPLNMDWHAESNQLDAEFGRSVAVAERLNGDSIADIIVGAAEYTENKQREGAAFVFYGGNPDVNGGVTGTPANAAWTGLGDLVNSRYGIAVASAGDVDNNTYDEVLVGARIFEEVFDNEGAVFLYQTTAAGTSVTPTWSLLGGRDNARLGASVSSAGDVNGDGFDDILLGANEYPDGQQAEGAAFVFHGASDLSGLGMTPNWTATLDQAFAFVGTSVAGVGDFNNDGFSDVVVGADGYDDLDPEEGAAFLYLGSPSGLPQLPTITFEIDQAEAGLGVGVSSAGDVNDDGYDDVLIGADGFTKNIGFEGGAFLFYGCADDDRDGVCQAADNCLDIANPDQDDTDFDGEGNVCDPCEDGDADTVCDASRVLISGSGSGEQVLVQFGTTMRWYANVVTFDPGWGTTWTDPSFNDGAWTLAQYGVGFETSGGEGVGNLIGLNGDTGPNKISVYTRAVFTLGDPASVDTVFLGADYDDGYVAWINGVEVFRSPQVPAITPDYDMGINQGIGLTEGHESSNGVAPNYGGLVDITSVARPHLVAGINVLSVGVWNIAQGSSDLIIVPRLSINRPVESSMKFLENSTDPGPISWTNKTFDDSSWAPGNFGIGYDDAGAADDLINSEVSSGTQSVFTRSKFTVSLGAIDDVFLGADHDDGYVAWINGIEVFRSPEMIAQPVTWNANPTEHESSNGTVPDYTPLADITTAAFGALQQGENVLALGVWRNQAGGADDLVVVPQLSINEAAVDNCIGVFNPSQADLNDDGEGDACDPDIDGDGLLNPDDNCPFVFNIPDTDTDLDGQGDACDVCSGDADNDVDADGICANTGFMAPKDGDGDNCPAVFNPDQKDLNLDNEGDACDPDIDGDGVPNITDNCVYEINDQDNFDSDPRGDDCDCEMTLAAVWEEPAPATGLFFARDDVCFGRTCTQSLGSCGGDLDCDHDSCVGFTCTEGLNACGDDLDCAQDVCQAFACTEGLNACADDSECAQDVCASKMCTSSPQGCNSNDDCTGDFCQAKTCTEGFNVCLTQADCTGGATDFCIGTCSIGGNSCASNVSCTADVCEGACSIGANVCSTDAQCTAPQTDLCRGTCSIGANSCLTDLVCTAPQTDLCRGTCSIGSNACANDTVCTAPQTDLCRGECSIGTNVCELDTACTAPDSDTLLWTAPTSFGALSGRYDTLRSTVADDFGASAFCLESDEIDERAEDNVDPASNEVRYYLIRVENDCPGGIGAMGQNSDEVLRSGRSCP